MILHKKWGKYADSKGVIKSYKDSPKRHKSIPGELLPKSSEDSLGGASSGDKCGK